MSLLSTMSGKGTLKYYFTLKHMKPIQIYGRVLHSLFSPRPDLSPPPPVRKRSGRTWVLPARRRANLLNPNRCRFLNEAHDIAAASAWNDPAREKLWLYNLHYFDDINAFDAGVRGDWQRALIDRWVTENPPGQGNGWEPYPASLRIVNWIKWALSGNALEPAWLHSLAVQTRWLAQRLEWHLLGNHLFVNAKALVFAGLFFEGKEASAWLEKGLAILAKEIPEQILPDGGQFERSPMYHALALEDMLDLINIAAAYPDAMPPRWQTLAGSWPETAGRMRFWLDALCHPDGEISFFNDAAIGIAPSPAELAAYAGRLGLAPPPDQREGVAHLAGSGYVRVQAPAMVALLDVALVGPDYLPGHAHADTLSFELSLFGQRVLVNSGTSRYGLGAERLRQRGTAAHNTVTLDGQDSSEVWGGFRVARRAKPLGLRLWEGEAGLRVLCGHDGYTRLPGKPVHWREWRFAGGGLEIIDNIEGRFGEAVGRLFFQPGLQPALDACGSSGQVGLADGHVLRWQTEGAQARLVAASHHPEFGLSEPNLCLELRFSGPRCLTRLNWD